VRRIWNWLKKLTAYWAYLTAVIPPVVGPLMAESELAVAAAAGLEPEEVGLLAGPKNVGLLIGESGETVDPKVPELTLGEPGLSAEMPDG
jgi:hypothetical protein